MPIHVMVDRRLYVLTGEIIRIGRDTDNEIVLSADTRLAGLHAVIKSVGGRWIIEAKEGNSLRVGAGRPSNFSWINPGDVILLTDSGPELVFEPVDEMLADSTQIKALKTTESNVLSSENKPLKSDTSSGKRTGQLSVSDARTKIKTAALNPATDSLLSISTKHLFLGLGIAFAVIAATGLWLFVRTGRPTHQTASANPETDSVDPVVLSDPRNAPRADKSSQAQSPIERSTPAGTVEPEEFLVLVGIQITSTDDRPHILGVGFLWNDQIAVTHRDVGEAIEVVVSESAQSETPRDGCIIQGITTKVAKVEYSKECPTLAILTLAEPSNSAPAASTQQISVESRDIERIRSLGKPITYFSYGKLPRPKLERKNHNFPLCEYDPETCLLKRESVRLMFEKQNHYVRFTEADDRPELGGLLCDQNLQVLGMVLPDSSCIWTKQLDHALAHWK